MSTTATTPSSIGVAPWKPLFLSHISKMESPEFVLSTLAPSDPPSSSSSSSSSSPPTTPYVPRARFCVFRGMWCELPHNKHNQIPAANAPVYESDMLTFTTDARMQKVPEIFASSAGHGDPSQSRGSGGGGPVEAVFWIKEAGAQWRFKGHAYVIGPDIEGGGDGNGNGSGNGDGDGAPDGESSSSGVRTVKSRVGEGMRVRSEEGKAQWSWRSEVSAHFANLSPLMKGSFKNPPPGTPVGEADSVREGEGMGQKVEGPLEEEEIAMRNFRVVVIKADEVEQLDTTQADKNRRYRFTYVGPKGGELGEWNKEELWP